MNNQVTIIGIIETEYKKYIKSYNEQFYQFFVSVKRTSGTIDLIPVVVSGRMIDAKSDHSGRSVYINGEFRSFNNHAEDGKTTLILYLFAQEIALIEPWEYTEDVNNVCMYGYLCKKPIYRKTPLGREIADLLIAVHRTYGKSDYIPCIAWGRNAYFASGFDVGSHIKLNGRIQSREYIKNEETKTAYEVSVNLIEVID